MTIAEVPVTVDPEAGYRCQPRSAPSCGGRVPIAKQTCPHCRQLQRRPLAPDPGDAPLLENVLLLHEGRPILLATECSASASGYLAKMGDKWAPRKVWGKPRLSGLGDRQAMFGTIQPQPLRRRYGCKRSSMARASDPQRWQAIADEAQSVLVDIVPAVAAFNVEAATPIAPCWKWRGTGWTSGVINFTQLLPYHRDAGNLAHTWSAMFGARSRVDGGHLHLPEFGVFIAVNNRSLICFPGGDVTHGVTPMNVRRDGWRVTAVFYGLRGCIPCAADEQTEIDRAARRATERARVVAKGHPA